MQFSGKIALNQSHFGGFSCDFLWFKRKKKMNNDIERHVVHINGLKIDDMSSTEKGVR